MDVAALVDVAASAAALNRLAGLELPWDFRRSLVAAAAEAVRTATWPQAAALLRDMTALQSVGRVFLDRVMARVGLALYREAHLGQAAAAHGALRAAFQHRSSNAAGTGSGSAGGSSSGASGDAEDGMGGGGGGGGLLGAYELHGVPTRGRSISELRVAHYRRAFARQLSRPGQPALSDDDILAAEAAIGAAEATSMLSNIAAVWQGRGGDREAGSRGEALARQVAGVLRWLMAYLPPLLPALPGGPAAVLPVLRQVTSCGWDHSR
jgi:hypothetical protein